jgi:methyl-accepting chemotaxis protein
VNNLLLHNTPAMTQLNQITQQNAPTSEELAATAEEMSSQAENLQQLVGFFRVEGAGAAPVPQAAKKSVGQPRAPKSAPRKALASSEVDESNFQRF